jgi:hypothetical protein
MESSFHTGMRRAAGGAITESQISRVGSGAFGATVASPAHAPTVADTTMRTAGQGSKDQNEAFPFSAQTAVRELTTLT